MNYRFSKYSGCGNTFLIFDNRDLSFVSSCVPIVCKKESVDGVICLMPSKKADYKFQIYNRDGSVAEMCGNGLRCFIKYLEELNLRQEFFLIETIDGVKKCKIIDQNVEVMMGQFDHDIEIEKNLFFINTGVPHAAIFVADVEKTQVFIEGNKIRHDERFNPAGTNVNFVQLINGFLKIRTFERGVEDETLACGTGATASALIASKKYNLSSPIDVFLRSKEKLTISFKTTPHGYEEVTMLGPAKKLSQGIVTL